MEKSYLIDTHSHIDMLEKISIENALKNADANGVKRVILPCAYPKDIEKISNIAQQYKNVYAYLGVHPTEAKDWNDDLITTIKKLLKINNKIVGIGEIGLDYYGDKSFVELQKEVFIKQIKLANELNLPINIHDREAHKDTFDIIQKYNYNSTVIMHCFSGSVEFAQDCIKAGYYIALGGVVTFKNAVKMKDVARSIPLDRLLLETDAPYLTPVPHRGEENQPAYVKFVAEDIATLRQTSFEEIATITTQNAERIFNFKDEQRTLR